MSTFTSNENTDYYEAMDGDHSIYIADDTFMIQFGRLQSEQGMSEAEAFDILDDIGW